MRFFVHNKNYMLVTNRAVHREDEGHKEFYDTPMATMHCTCRLHSNKGACLILLLDCPLHMHLCACTCNTVTDASSSYPLPSSHVCTAIFPPRRGLRRHISTTFTGHPFPVLPPPLCTQITSHSPTPTSLPDNTAARHPIIFMHTLHTHSRTAVHSDPFVGRDA